MTIPKIKLNTGAEMPQIGFGLWKNTDEAECKQSIEWALQAGYRHFDTAQAYGNEKWLGDVLAAKLQGSTGEAGEGAVPLQRDDLFVTTKIAVEHFGHKHTLKSFDNSYKNLQVGAVDLLLLHFPVTVLRDKSWEALQEIHASGRAKAIGVSNYTIRHLEELLHMTDIKPAVNQVELHVFLQQPELVAYCEAHGIVVQAYSPLAHGNGLDNEILLQIGAKYRKSPTQIMLRWCIEQGTVPLPKSVHRERIIQNIDIFDFELDQIDTHQLTGLERNLRTCWSPVHVP